MPIVPCFTGASLSGFTVLFWVCLDYRWFLFALISEEGRRSPGPPRDCGGCIL